ncbi:6850_t:CDS:10 [Paraglomus occultum]|uniref:6850_t:CDS:1 n=1 Tax=Paraglomus occultum TaxID=144539 RepID=A0A9N9AIV5_9GLOM|nr:6850_t:CDS:10 [Paraglomus occultum]
MDKREKFIGVAGGLGNNINNMIGAGIFSSPGTVWRNVGSPWIALILWAIGGFVSLCGTLTYTELGSQFHGAGETTYFEYSFPKPRLLLSYSFTMVYIVIIRPAGISAVANVCAQYLLFTLGLDAKGCDLYYDFHPPYFQGSNFWRLRLITIAILAVIALYHSLSNKWSNRINQALVMIKVLTILTVVILGLSFAKASAERANNGNRNWKSFSTADPSFYDVSATTWIQRYITAMLTILFAYSGWNNLNYLTDEYETGGSYRNLWISNAGAVGIVTLLYLLANFAYTAVLDVSTITGSTGSDPNEIIGIYFATQISKVNDEIENPDANIKTARALAFFIALSAFGAAAVLMQSASRVVEKAGEHNYVPYISTWLTTWNTRLGTPVNSFIALFTWCSFLTLIVPGSSPFEFLTELEQYSAYFFFLLTAIGALKLRRKGWLETRAYRAPLFAVLLFILFAFLIVVLAWVPEAHKSSPATSTILTNATALQCPTSKINTYAVFGTSLGAVMLTGVLWWFLGDKFTREEENEK